VSAAVLPTAAAPVLPTAAPAVAPGAAGTPFTVVTVPAPVAPPAPVTAPVAAPIAAPVAAVAPSSAPAATAPAPAPGVEAGPTAPAVLDVAPVAATRHSADTSGSTSDDASAGSGAPASAAPAPPAGVDPGVAVPVPPVTSGTPASAPADVPAPRTGGDPPVAAQLSQQLAVLTNAPDGSQTMTLVITPDDLGPVSIQATVTGGNLDLTLHGAHEHGRHALADALPELRRDLESAGITLTRLEVAVDTGDSSPWARAAQQQLADSSGGQHRPGQPGGQPRAWSPAADHPGEGGPAPTSDLSASRGVDVRV
jgi:hypothetical protein